MKNLIAANWFSRYFSDLKIFFEISNQIFPPRSFSPCSASCRQRTVCRGDKYAKSVHKASLHLVGGLRMFRHAYLTGGAIVMWRRTSRHIHGSFSLCLLLRLSPKPTPKSFPSSHCPLFMVLLLFCYCWWCSMPELVSSFLSVCVRSDGDWKWENIAIYLGGAAVLVCAPRAILNPLSPAPTPTRWKSRGGGKQMGKFVGR